MKSVYVGIIGLIVVAIYMFTAQNLAGNREKQFFIRFDTINISGYLEYAKIGYHGCVFKIQGTEEEFIFYPITNELNNNRIFYHIAKKGDLVNKKPYSDTLNIIKKGKIYSYIFRKPFAD